MVGLARETDDGLREGQYVILRRDTGHVRYGSVDTQSLLEHIVKLGSIIRRTPNLYHRVQIGHRFQLSGGKFCSPFGRYAIVQLLAEFGLILWVFSQFPEHMCHLENQSEREG